MVHADGSAARAGALHLAALCRAGFEADLCAELSELLAGARVHSPQAALVRVDGATRCPRLDELVYARDLIVVDAELPALDPKDRLTPIRAALTEAGIDGPVAILAPDADATKPLAPLAEALGRRFSEARGERAGAVWLAASTHALVGHAPPGGGAPFPGGVPRLKMPREAPSRSTLKLEEAFHVLLTPAERAALLKPGMKAVDLGAAPGGWTFQFVSRAIRVAAIDNGRMDSRLMDSGLVEHHRVDGFRYRPPKPVDWLACDMVEKPSRVAELVARWLAGKHCRAAIFNLKLPMKQRHAAWQAARAMLLPALDGRRLRARQLYHDREEITVAVVPVVKR